MSSPEPTQLIAERSPTGAPTEAPHAWIGRHRALRAKLAVVVGLLALLSGGIAWMAGKLFRIRPGNGTPVGLCVRTDTHIATWIRTLEAYVPSPHRDGSKDRFTLSVLLVPLGAGNPQLVPVQRGLAANEFALARILGSDRRSLWVQARGIATIDLASFAVRQHAGPVPNGLRPAAASRLSPDPAEWLAAGYFASERTWLGVHSDTEVERDHRVGQFVRRIVRSTGTKEMRRFHRGMLEPDSTGRYFRITSLVALGEARYLGAAFLCTSPTAEPVRLRDPDSALLVSTSAPGLAGTLVVARTDDAGNVLWQTDTGIDRFSLQQILPGATTTAFVGTRPRRPDHVPEPLLVIVDHEAGGQVAHSLWR